jgi:type II secretory pathway component GspD/PulD (secretin)
MRWNCDERGRRMMKFASGIFAMALVLALGGSSAWGQAATADAGSDSYKTFYLTNVNQASDVNEVVVALRNLLDPRDKIFLVPSQNAILVRASAEQLVFAQKLLKDIDRAKKAYRLIYTITEMDSGKTVGTQSVAIIVVSGGRTVLRNGSKVPIMTGSATADNTGTQTQVTYLDVGLNIDASLDESVNGVMLRSKVERSSVTEEKSGVGAQDPVIRSTRLEGTSILTLGKKVMLGSLDIPGSTRHLDLEVVMETAP